MRNRRRWESEANGGVQLWTVPVAVLAVMVTVSLIRSVAAPEAPRVRRVAPVGAAVAGMDSGHQQTFDGEGGGGGTGQAPLAAEEQPVGRLRD